MRATIAPKGLEHNLRSPQRHPALPSAALCTPLPLCAPSCRPVHNDARYVEAAHLTSVCLCLLPVATSHVLCNKFITLICRHAGQIHPICAAQLPSTPWGFLQQHCRYEPTRMHAASVGFHDAQLPLRILTNLDCRLRSSYSLAMASFRSEV